LLNQIDLSQPACKFPFYYKGKKFNECILLSDDLLSDDEDEYLYSVFSCPVRDTTEKIDGINSFSKNDELCLNAGMLDPSVQTCTPQEKRYPFYECNNNCPGVRGLGLVGGGVLLAGVSAVTGGVLLAGVSAVTGVTAILPALGIGGVGVGALAVGGMMMANCAGPLFCIASSGQCCLAVFDGRRLLCPTRC